MAALELQMLRIVAFLSLAGALALILANYGMFSGAIWQVRFRRVGGVDHVGPLLEGGFLFLTLLGLTLTTLFLFPNLAFPMVRFPSVAMFCFMCVLGITAVNALVLGPIQVEREFPKQFPEAFQAFQARGAWLRECKRLRHTYLAYAAYSLVLNEALAAIAFLLLNGLYSDLATLQQFRGIAPAHAALASPGSAEWILGSIQASTYDFELFRSAFVERLARFLGGIGIVFLLMLWIFGTAFQEVYTRSTVLIIRLGTLVMLCGFVLIGTFGYYVAYMHATEGTLQAITAGSRAITSTATWAEHLTELLSLRDRFELRSAVGTIVADSGKSGPGLGFLAAAALLIVKQLRGKSTMLRRLVPHTASLAQAFVGGSSENEPQK